MKNKLLLLMIPALMLASCTSKKPLYSWNGYDKTSYTYLKNNDEKATKALIKNYKTIIEKQKGSRHIVPPGVYADYGFVLLQAGKTKEGSDMLKKEIELYPESKVFIDRVIKML